MIDIEKLKNVKRLVTHANCPDGVASALIIKDALPDVEVTFMAQGTKEHRELRPDVPTLFCDFTPWSDPKTDAQWLMWTEAGTLVLDHHPTQRELTMTFVEAGLGAYGENDRNECGAWLAYEHVWMPIHKCPDSDCPHCKRVRAFAELAGVRDTWKRDDPRFEEASRQANMLTFLPKRLRSEMRLLDALAFCKDEKLAAIVREREIDHAFQSISENHGFTTQRGTRVFIFQGVTPTSDAAEILDQSGPGWTSNGDEVHQPDIVVGFHYRVDAGRLQLQFSTRSHTGYDVGAFCKHYGGGGHKGAAGFAVEQSFENGANPYVVFRMLLEVWEAGQ